ncbi:MAG: helix-turn-helix transcriptional regulator [Alistipes sp.]|jgi:AraC-like DNA-binding protein/uncharacterized cupin superfamily protein|nr:helix-turn-helix transcriptional regulator [Alistipes sp.]
MMMDVDRIELPNVEAHTSCVCYQKGDARTIRICNLECGGVYQSVLDAHNIIFILQGSVNLSTHNVRESVSLDGGDFVFLTSGTKLYVEAREPASMIFVKLDNVVGQIPECDTFRFQRSASPKAAADVGIYPLRANERINVFFECLVRTEADGLKCGSYAKLVVGQLLFLIQVYYPQSEYTRFYSMVLSPDVMLSDFVMANWQEYPTTSGLADALNMTPAQLTSRFRKVFKTTPKAWLQARKAEYVYHDLCSSHKTIKSIAHEYGLSMPNFARFCRDNFGKSPAAIRDNLNTRFDGEQGGGGCGCGLRARAL